MVVAVGCGGGIVDPNSSKLHWQGHEGPERIGLLWIGVEEGRHEGASDGFFDRYKRVVYTTRHPL